LPHYDRIVFPGTLFAGSPRDFEASAKGSQRGFYIVHFSDSVEKVEFVPIELCKCFYHEYDVSNENSIQAQHELTKILRELDVNGRLALIKVYGELSGGKTSGLKFAELKKLLMDRGAIHVEFNKYGLSSKDYASIKVAGEDVTAISSRLFKENIGTVKLSNNALKGDSGASLAMELLKAIRQEQKMGETKKDYETRITGEAIKTLRLEDNV
jgi:hypothetical protein